MFCWIQLSIITFPFSFDDIMTSNSWSLKSTNYCLVQLPWDLNFGLNIVHSWVTCFACSMKQNLGQISQQAADVIISGWGGLSGLTSQFFMVKNPSIFAGEVLISVEIPVFLADFSLVGRWKSHICRWWNHGKSTIKSSQFLGTPRCVPKSTSVSRHRSRSTLAPPNWKSQVTSFFAPASRSGTPEELKYLVDTAHGARTSMVGWFERHWKILSPVPKNIICL